MMLVYYILGSLTAIIISSFIYRYKIKQLEYKINGKLPGAKSKYLRKGIYHPRVYDYKDPQNPIKINVEAEVGELERSDTQSKIEVIDYKVISPGHNKQQKIIDITEGWHDSTKIKWLKNESKNRTDKIDNLLED